MTIRRLHPRCIGSLLIIRIWLIKLAGLTRLPILSGRKRLAGLSVLIGWERLAGLVILVVFIRWKRLIWLHRLIGVVLHVNKLRA